MVKVLIQQPTINLNTRDKDGYTAFYYACDHDERIINVLFTTGKIKISELKGFRDFVQNEDGSEQCTYMRKSSEMGKDRKIMINSAKIVESIVDDTHLVQSKVLNRKKI